MTDSTSPPQRARRPASAEPPGGSACPVGAVDIGSNSVRLLILDSAGHELVREMRITRLGQGVDVSGALDPAAMDRTFEVLSQYAAQLTQHGVARVRATATSAARDAANRAVFFDQAQRILEVYPELLSGEDEAVLSFRGATAGLDTARGPFLVIDVGGGSTEFVLGHAAPEQTLSLPMGCVRMTERHLHSDPPSSAEIDACAADVRGELTTVKKTLSLERARCVVGLAGTVTSIAALELGLDHYDAEQTHHMRLSRPRVEAQVERLSRANRDERKRILAEPGRADVIVGGAVVLSTILRELALDELLVSERDILDGLAMSLR